MALDVVCDGCAPVCMPLVSCSPRPDVVAMASPLLPPSSATAVSTIAAAAAAAPHSSGAVVVPHCVPAPARRHVRSRSFATPPKPGGSKSDGEDLDDLARAQSRALSSAVDGGAVGGVVGDVGWYFDDNGVPVVLTESTANTGVKAT